MENSNTYPADLFLLTASIGDYNRARRVVGAARNEGAALGAVYRAALALADRCGCKPENVKATIVDRLAYYGRAWDADA